MNEINLDCEIILNWHFCVEEDNRIRVLQAKGHKKTIQLKKFRRHA